MNKTVLIIDDDNALRNTLSAGLRTANFNVLTANSAENGMAVLSRISVDAIVLDRMMVGMDGLTMLKKLRNDGNMTPVIMLTALGGAENAISGLDAGANDYLSKPFQLRELVLRLNNIIRNTATDTLKLPDGLIVADDDFFINDDGAQRILPLSGEEKKLLHGLITPIGNIVAASPMVAKRLRNKINGVLSDTDIINVRGQGYKLVKVPRAEKI